MLSLSVSKMKKELLSSQSYKDASLEVKEVVTNGCGPGGWKFDIIPDTMYGLSIKEACNIHDWDYSVGTYLADKLLADKRLLSNLNILIDNYKGWSCFLNPLRRLRALEYYEAVHIAGYSAYWKGKEVK
jgi:hypothetical protein